MVEVVVVSREKRLLLQRSLLLLSLLLLPLLLALRLHLSQLLLPRSQRALLILLPDLLPLVLLPLFSPLLMPFVIILTLLLYLKRPLKLLKPMRNPPQSLMPVS